MFRKIPRTLAPTFGSQEKTPVRRANSCLDRAHAHTFVNHGLKELRRLAGECCRPDQDTELDVSVLRRLREIRRRNEDFPRIDYDALGVKRHRAFARCESERQS